ncbi:5-deoxy-glucuronate isomerase [Acidaminobacter sp. JC074]|uniref:5-deoxy-glucuronate isomerase n=1 Tax=Acidaminobacter sp. JC074 TaxID=2530199 RepID=UPI001F10FA08|nr:5-deoxy-glucuronate isomerase [Acidaminobacter sp. JC074]MCH4889822.1 5-deoxy-glucuronate isomerase [Acidaminobacter sp. JC074]
MLRKLDAITHGRNILSEMDGLHSDMLMDVDVYKMSENETLTIEESEKEVAVLIMAGRLEFTYEDNRVKASRSSLFDEDPTCLHVCKSKKVVLKALETAEVLVQKTTNDREFDSKFYKPEDCTSDVFGDGVLGDTSRRVVRTVFDYKNAPYSNMVMGEVINYPGKWSSYPPHHHPQPEIYYYRFNKPQGFGCSIIGEDVHKITDNSMSAIPGGLVHPQTTAPGYAMYYCWMIRHLDNNPWTERVDDEDHVWLLDSDVKIWPEKE